MSPMSPEATPSGDRAMLGELASVAAQSPS
jgi:hypothetical protein